MVEKTNACNELLSVFLSYVALSNSLIYEFNEVVMTAKIKIISFFYFAVNYFCNVEVV